MLHELMVKDDFNANKSVLWVCKNQPAGSSQRLKPRNKRTTNRNSGRESKDVFDEFVSHSDVKQILYKETEKILGTTCGMCILQDFEAITPNNLARTVETVEGGGLVVLLLESVKSLTQLCSMQMDVHSRYKTEAYSKVVPRFNKRFVLSLISNESCLIIGDDLTVLPNSHECVSFLKSEEQTSITHELPRILETFQGHPFKSLLSIAKTADQFKAVIGFIEAITEKRSNHTVALTAGRGRGKSAALGVSIAAAIISGYSNIFITSPDPENLKTLFQFIIKGLTTSGYRENIDFEVIRSSIPTVNKSIVGINVSRGTRQTIQYIQPTRSDLLGQAELLVIDEAAAIPLPIVKSLMGQYTVFMASTINGYEGTGRSLSLKLIQQLRDQQSGQKSRDKSFLSRTLKEINLNEPIRYAIGDPIEQWLNNLLCLDASVVRRTLPIENCPKPSECSLYCINRDNLFSFNSESEEFLNKVMALFVESHYKNSPNDLQLLSDAPAHQLYVLMATDEPLCAVQLALEGGISKNSVRRNLNRGLRADGDLIPWLLAQQFQSENFAGLFGGRIVRIATHPDYVSKGYGARALELLQEHFKNVPEQAVPQFQVTASPITDEINSPDSTTIPSLLTAVSQIMPPYIHYLGVSYGLTSQLNKFWKTAGYSPVYLRQSSNELTGEHSCIMVKVLEGRDDKWLSEFAAGFHRRFINLLNYEFSGFTVVQALSVIDGERVAATKYDNNPRKLNKFGLEELLLSGSDLKRLESYANNLLDFAVIIDLLPMIAQLYFNDRLPTSLKLSIIQSAFLLGVGLQKKSIDAVSEEFNLPVNQALALFTTIIRKVTSSFREILDE